MQDDDDPQSTLKQAVARRWAGDNVAGGHAERELGTFTGDRHQETNLQGIQIVDSSLFARVCDS